MRMKAVAVALTVMGSFGLTTLTGTSAHAAQCFWGPSASSGWLTGTLGNKYNRYNFYTGPSTSCPKTGVSVTAGSTIGIRCKSSGWYYVENLGDRGWVSAGNFSSTSGSPHNC